MKAQVVEDVTGNILDQGVTIDAIGSLVNYHLADGTEQKGIVTRSMVGITTASGATVRLYVVPLVPPTPV